MEFFDSNCYIGRPRDAGFPSGPVRPAASAEQLLSAMDRAGIARGLVWHIGQLELDPDAGNRLLCDAIAGSSRLIGCWTVLPNQTGELGDLDGFFARAVEAGVRAFRMFPSANRYLLRPPVVGPVLERMHAGRLPLLLSIGRGVAWQEVYDLMDAFPELTVILCDLPCWGQDRLFRPLVQRYANLHLEISGYMLDGGIEAFVRDYGPRQLLFGTGWPAAYQGAMMLALAQAEIGPADKQAVAAGNLERILGAVKA